MEYRMSEAFEAAKKEGSAPPPNPVRRVRVVLKWPEQPPPMIARSEHGVPFPIVNGLYPSWTDCEFFIDGRPMTNVRRVKIDLEAGTDVPIALVEFIGPEIDIELPAVDNEAMGAVFKFLASLLDDTRIYHESELGRRVVNRRVEIVRALEMLSAKAPTEPPPVTSHDADRARRELKARGFLVPLEMADVEVCEIRRRLDDMFPKEEQGWR